MGKESRRNHNNISTDSSTVQREECRGNPAPRIIILATVIIIPLADRQCWHYWKLLFQSQPCCYCSSKRTCRELIPPITVSTTLIQWRITMKRPGHWHIPSWWNHHYLWLLRRAHFYRRCGEGLINCLRELAPPNWLGQSMDILKRMIQKSSHEDINPSNVLYTGVGCLMGCAWHPNIHAWYYWQHIMGR